MYLYLYAFVYVWLCVECFVYMWCMLDCVIHFLGTNMYIHQKVYEKIFSHIFMIFDTFRNFQTTRWRSWQAFLITLGRPEIPNTMLWVPCSTWKAECNDLDFRMCWNSRFRLRILGSSWRCEKQKASTGSYLDLRLK